MATVYVMIPVELSGNRPDNTLPGGSGGAPDNTLPEIPPEIWPTPPGGGEPTHPIYIPVYPDNTLPGSQPGVDNTLPGSQPGPDNTLPPAGSGGTPDQSLPGSQPEATHPIAPIYIPIYPPVGGGGSGAQPKR